MQAASEDQYPAENLLFKGVLLWYVCSHSTMLELDLSLETMVEAEVEVDWTEAERMPSKTDWER